MQIGGLVKTSTLDYPGFLSAVVFTRGCNFICPYCHNPQLFGADSPALTSVEVFDFLTKRRKVLDGVVISGGEPTLQPGLADFCRGLKTLGYRIKLDTNGSRPEVLEVLLNERLLDYVAMDIKSVPGEYPEAITPNQVDNKRVLDGLALVKAKAPDYEFRVTCVAPFVDEGKLKRMAEAAAGPKTMFLQPSRLEKVLTPEFFQNNPQPVHDYERLIRLASVYLDCRLR